MCTRPILHCSKALNFTFNCGHAHIPVLLILSLVLNHTPDKIQKSLHNVLTRCPLCFSLLCCKQDTQNCVSHHPPSHLYKQHLHVHPIASLTWHASVLCVFSACFFCFGFALIRWRVSADDVTSELTRAYTQKDSGLSGVASLAQRRRAGPDTCRTARSQPTDEHEMLLHNLKVTPHLCAGMLSVVHGEQGTPGWGRNLSREL